jgi:hypothetical protein
LQHGYAYLIGTALLVPLFIPARWRGKRREEIDDRDAVVSITPAPYNDDLAVNGRADEDAFSTGAHHRVSDGPTGGRRRWSAPQDPEPRTSEPRQRWDDTAYRRRSPRER